MYILCKHTSSSERSAGLQPPPLAERSAGPQLPPLWRAGRAGEVGADRATPPSRRIASTPNPSTTSPSCDMLVEDRFGAPSLVYFPVKPPGHITCDQGGSGRPLRSATHTYRLGIKCWCGRWIGCGRICQVAAASQPF